MSTLKTNKIQTATDSDLTLDTGSTSKRIVIPLTTGDDVDLDALSGRLVIGDVAAAHLAIDGNEIQAKSNTTTAAELLLMADGGEVQIFGTTPGKMGIGTDDPKNTLQISHTGADGDNGLLIVREDSSTSDTDLLGGVGFDSTDGNVPSSVTEASAFIAAYAAEVHSTGDKGADLVFGTSAIDDNDDTASHERMRITDAGNVGIGTNDPHLPLDILEIGGLICGYTAVDSGGATETYYEIPTSYDVPADTWRIRFKAPKSGKVELQFLGNLVATSGNAGNINVYLGLSSGGNGAYSAINAKYEKKVAEPDEDDNTMCAHSWYVDGLTAGTVYDYYIGTKVTSGTTIRWYYGGTNADQSPPIIIRAITLPSTVPTTWA